MLGAFVEGFPDIQVITEFDILTVSDGTNLVIAHTGGTYNLVAGELELLATLLHEARQVWIGFLFHFLFFLIIQCKCSDFFVNAKWMLPRSFASLRMTRGGRLRMTGGKAQDDKRKGLWMTIC